MSNNQHRGRRPQVRADGNRLVIGEKVDWSTSIDFRKSIYGTFNRKGYSDVVVDFSESRKPYANGIVPIAMELDAYRKAGCDITLIPPNHPGALGVFRANNWLHCLDPYHWEDSKNLDSALHLPLSKFHNDDELNELVSHAVEICIQQLVFAHGVPQAFEWALNEIAGNVLVHAGASVQGWVQITTYKDNHRLALVVADSGMGIPSSMADAFTLRNDLDALERAVEAGVTSKPDFGQGNGLAGSIAITQNSGGMFAAVSGRARLRILGSEVTARNHFPPFQGTFVEMQFDTDREIDLPKALWGHEPTNYFETKYESPTEDKYEVSLREYASSFGNRITGQRIRNIILNLLENRQQPIAVQMEGVAIVSSSFADELFGKLFVHFGPLEFSRIVELKGLNPTVRSIIDRAVAQRMAQSLGASDAAELTR